jgi:replicative DNA helicase
MDLPADPGLYCEVSERGMTGCIVSTGGAVMDELPLTGEHFFGWKERQVFGAAQRLHGAGKSIDLFSVLSELGRETVTKIGHAEMTELCHYPAPSLAATFHATLCEQLTLRRADALGRWMTAEASLRPNVGQFCATASARVAGLEVLSDNENVLKDAVEQAKARIGRMERGEKPLLLQTPIEAWNRMFGGIADGRFYAIASRPGLGKTAMLEQMATTYLMRNECVVIFEKDMAPQLLVERIACREASVPFWKYDREQLDADQCRRVRLMLDALDPGKLLIFNPNGLTAEKLCAIARRAIRTHKAKVIFLDHIQALRFPGKDLREGLTMSSLTLRANVTETNVPHVVLAHINRDGSKGRPQPENIKEFDQLFGDVDALALLWSEVEAADIKPFKKRPMKLYSAKNRGGAVTEETLFFNGPLLKFETSENL